MSNHEFTLKSGEKLHVSSPNLDAAAELMEAMQKFSLGKDPSMEISGAMIFDSSVRAAIKKCWPHAMWGIHKISEALFNDPIHGEKATSDFIEISSKLIEVVTRSFFLNLSSKYTTPHLPTTESPRSP